MTLTRRSVLAGAAAGACSVAAGPSLFARAAFAAGPVAPASDVLVVLSLRGGMDGLSAVAPLGDPGYAAARPSIALPASRALSLDPMFGLHPALGALKPFYDAGSLAFVHAVGSPDPTRSHFDATEEMERAAFGTTERTGWVDRWLAAQPGTATFRAVSLGDLTPYALMGSAPSVGMTALADFKLGIYADIAAPFTGALQALHADVSSPATAAFSTATLRMLTATATAASATGTSYTPSGGASYPATPLGQALTDVARLIKAGVGLQVLCLEMGDWDMHQGLGAAGGADGGWMHDQLGDLGGALAAFATDLGPGLANVTLATLTEFGRRVEENGSGGVDHGHGSLVTLLGGGIRGGKVYGRWPGLAPAQLDDGDLAGTTDYRAVLAELLATRCGMADTAAVFPGFTRADLGLCRSR